MTLDNRIPFDMSSDTCIEELISKFAGMFLSYIYLTKHRVYIKLVWSVAVVYLANLDNSCILEQNIYYIFF